MKTIYTFPVEKKLKDAQGVETSITHTFAIKRPTRSEYEEADEVYGAESYRCVRAGMPTNAMLARQYGDDGGFLTKEGKKDYLDIQVKFLELRNEYQRLSLAIKRSDDPDKLKEKIREVEEGLISTRDKMQDFESLESAVFEKTADTKARNKTILWWVTQLSHERNDETGEWNPVFSQKDFQGKLGRYDEILESEDEFLQLVVQKLGFFITLWALNKAAEPGDFDLYNEEVSLKDDEKENNDEQTAN